MSADDAGAIVRQGHLRKLKTMKKKYFVLRAETRHSSAKLEYYESEKKFRAKAPPRRIIALKSCYNITRRLDLKQKHVIALFTREEQFCVVAENEEELIMWLKDILKQHSDDVSEELLRPIQHVWLVSVQKKGLGTSKNIQGLYNLCLTDKTLTMVKIKSHNNVISDLGIPERIEYSLKNIRRCGDSECFFYMEVGRQTVTGAGELWMHVDDSNIAQSMHSTIYHSMRNCAKEAENEKDHVMLPSLDTTNSLPARRQTYSGGRTRSGLSNDKGLCVGSCIRQCVCSSATYSIDDSAAAIAPLHPANAENQPPNNSLITADKGEHPGRVIKHHRTVSLPTGCPLYQEPLKIVHERTRSAPLTGDEVDRVTVERAARHSSCKAVNGTDSLPKKMQWSRRASTGTRLSKLSPAHTKNTSTLRTRCDSMPSRTCATIEADRPPTRHSDIIEGLEALNFYSGLDTSRDEPDSTAEWHRTPRIPEEPDYCEMGPKDVMSTSVQSRGGEEAAGAGAGAGADGYLPMGPGAGAGRSHASPLAGCGMFSASSGSVCSGTPSTDPRFSEYNLAPATSHLSEEEERPMRAYSVGSRPAGAGAGAGAGADLRHRAYSVGARVRPRPAPAHHPHHAHHAHYDHGNGRQQAGRSSSSAPLLPHASAYDLMELDFSNNSPTTAKMVSRTPPSGGGAWPSRGAPLDEYVDMSPRADGGYVEMRPGERPPAPPTQAPPDGYVEMRCGRPPAALTPGGSQTIFPLSLESPESPEEGAAGPSAPCGLHYAALDLEPRAGQSAPAPRLYTQIDFARSEHLHAADGE